MSKKKLAFTIFEVLFVAVIPLALVITNYSSWGTEANTFKIAFTGILLLFFVFYIIKKIILNTYIERARAMLTQHKADMKVETDASKKEKLMQAIKRGQAFETIITYIFPFLLLGGLYVLSQALETAAVQLSGTIGLISASVVIGFLFSMLAAREVN